MSTGTDTTFGQAGARFRWRMTSGDQGLIGYGDGVVDFSTGRVASEDHFLMADETASSQGAQATTKSTARTIVADGALYVLTSADDSDEEWLALETGSGGIAATVLAPLLWLRASPLYSTDAAPEQGRHDVRIDLAEFLAQHDDSERPPAAQLLEFGRVGLSQQDIKATVWIDAAGMVERMVTQIPPGVSPIIPVGHPAVELDTEIRWLPHQPPKIPTPDAHMRVRAHDYIRETLAESGISGWSEDFD